MYENLKSFIPNQSPAVRREADMNAVVIQVFPGGERFVSIICKDEEMYPQLREAAKEITGF